MIMGTKRRRNQDRPDAAQLLERAPSWLLRPLPTNAVADDQLHAKIDKLAEKLPETIHKLSETLDGIRSFREYDAAANRASLHVWYARERFFENGDWGAALLRFAAAHMVEGAL